MVGECNTGRESMEHYPDVYFTPGYGRAAASTKLGRWQSIQWEDRVRLPYVVSASGDNVCDAISPYGYSGIYVAPACTPGDLALFWKLACERLRAEGVVAVFLRFSPLDDASRECAASLEGIRMTRRGDTVMVPVRHGADAVWTAMEGRARTAIRKAEKVGLVGDIRPAVPADLGPEAPFRNLYEETMRRVKSAPGYLFDDRYYQSLLSGLGDDLMIATVRQPDGAAVAASLVMAHRDRVHYHLSGSVTEGSRSGANNLLLWTILRWAAADGRSTVHLGGGLAYDDGLFRFKRSYGGSRTQFWTGAVVLDRSPYERLVERRAAELVISVAELQGTGYFPAYRFRCDRV